MFSLLPGFSRGVMNDLRVLHHADQLLQLMIPSKTARVSRLAFDPTSVR
jgi:hypothetical protein